MSCPTSIAAAPDGRLFITERTTGNIRIVKDGVLLDQPFAHLDVALTGETGLLGIALDPDFASNGYLYVYRTVCEVDSPAPCDHPPIAPPYPTVHNEVIRFRADGDLGVEMTILLALPGNYLQHNSGNIAFGPDGKMYIPLGDNGNADNSQNRDVWPGKILRFNRDGSIPDDGVDPGSPMFAYGFRNPFDLAFDPFTGNLFVTENGSDNWDEINLVIRAENYGWPRARGRKGSERWMDPIWTVEKTVAPTGITVYRGDLIPGLKGALLWCEWNTQSLRGGLFTDERHVELASAEVIGHCSLDVAEGPDGTLYLSDITSVYRVP